jgi:hypothetical protein
LADPVHQHGLAVIGESLDQRQHQRGAAKQQEERGVTGNEDAVEHRLHQPGAQRGAAGGQPHA